MSYIQQNESISSQTDLFGKAFDLISPKYENILTTGALNARECYSLTLS